MITGVVTGNAKPVWAKRRGAQWTCSGSASVRSTEVLLPTPGNSSVVDAKFVLVDAKLILADAKFILVDALILLMCELSDENKRELAEYQAGQLRRRLSRNPSLFVDAKFILSVDAR